MIEITIRDFKLEFPHHMDAEMLNSCREYLEGFMDVARKYNMAKNKSEIVFAGLMLVLDNFYTTDAEDDLCEKSFFEIELLGYTYMLEGPVFRKQFYEADARIIGDLYCTIQDSYPEKSKDEQHLLTLMYFAYDNFDRWNRNLRY